MRTAFTIAAILLTAPAQAATVISAAGADADAIRSVVDTFRDELGGLNAPAPVNVDGGRRQINWDAAPDAVSDPNAFPGDFFNTDFAPRARGVAFSATGSTTGFLLSATEASGQPTGFGFGDEFGVFSPERLFAPVGGTTFDVGFFDPRNPDGAALSRGLGIVFSGVDSATSTSLSFFGADGALLSQTVFAEVGALSFLGVLFDDPLVASVSVTSGEVALLGNGQRSGAGDAVVMDDFIFGEPTPVAPIPLPAAAWMLLAGLGGLAALGQRRV